MIMRHLQSLWVFVLVFCASCSGAGRDSGSAGIDAEPRPIHRLYRDLYRYKSMPAPEREALRDSLPDVLTAMMQVVTGADSITDGILMGWSNSMPVEIFTPAVDSIYAGIEDIESALGAILSNATAEGLRIPEYDYAAVVWGRPQSIVRNGNVVMIALNHYLGADYPGYSHWAAYRRTVKIPEMIPYDLAESLVAMQYPFSPEGDATALCRMLYEGALTEAKMRLVRNADIRHSLGYDVSQMEWLEEYETRIWNELAAKKIIYDTDPSVAGLLVSPSPSTPLVNGNCPGRVGRYVGYRIVRAYLDRYPDTSLEDLLSPLFYDSAKTLLESEYAGK